MIQLCCKKENEKNKLYVLRYKHSGNYYVGTAEDLKKRMSVHWKRISQSKKRLPEWSSLNESTKGFIYYWFYIDGDGVSRSEADLCENHLAKLITRKIKYINEKNFIEKVHVGNNKFIDGIAVEDKKDKNKYVENKGKKLNDIDKEIYNYLIKLRSLKPKKVKKRLSIKCFEIGYIGKYHQNDSWDEAVVLFKFSCGNRENNNEF